MDKKVKILVIPSDKFGVGYWRSVQPHTYIQKKYPEYFDVDIVYEFPQDKSIEEFVAPYDVIHIHKQLDRNLEKINTLKFLGKKVIVDIDDNYYLGNDHPLSITAKKENWAKPIIEHLKLADYVSTTTPIFAKQISKLNKNVLVYPNAVDPEEEQFIPKPTEDQNGRLRVGIICGSSHLKDIELMDGMAQQLGKEYLDKIQFVLCGFDTRGVRTIYDKDTGKVTRRPIEPMESVWYEYERRITNNYSIVSPQHKEFLHRFIQQAEYPDLNEPYRRCWTKDINQYATHYNNIDVLLVPLKENDFNKVKSQLKVVEAGFFHKAIIAQNFGPYTIDLKPMIGRGGEIDENGNALLVETSKNHKQWAKYIKRLVDEPEMVKKLQENLYNTVKDDYSIKKVARERAQKYLEICGITDVTLE